MKRKVLANLVLIPSALLTIGCNKATSRIPSVVDLDNIAFSSDSKIQDYFGGLGVEWGTYEDTDKLADNAQERIYKNMTRLGAARVRMMVSYEWFVYNYDNKGTKDKLDDTWQYNFQNKYAKNTVELLTYCQLNNIDVAFGCWNVLGDVVSDDWDMFTEVTSDPRWATITADILYYLVKQKGFTCIKWFVNTNEPNYVGKKGSSKSYNNTYDIWAQGVKNVRKALDNLDLNNIGIVGGDVTGFPGCKEYLINISKGLKKYVGDYGAHLYVSNYPVDRGELYSQIRDLYNQIKEKDKGLGIVRQADLWECGLLDGKTALDCQSNIMTVDYAIRMADYTVQSLAAGINGLVYWDFDDAMHFMYNESTVTPKEWGMFSTLAEASSTKQELRPWYHSSTLLCNLFKKGNKIYSPYQNEPELDNTFRCLGTINKDNNQGGFIAVNQGLKSVTKTFYMEDKVEGNELYIYNFDENSYRIGEDGYIAPNQVITGSLNKKITLEIPSFSFVVISNTRL